MHDARQQAVVVGDRVVAAGLLVEDGASHRLLLRGEGLYAELLGETDAFALPVSGLTGPQPSGMVTVRGVWTGEAVVDAVVAEGGRGVASYARLDKMSFPEVSGVSTRSEILRGDVLKACDALRGDALVAFLAARGPRGWFGLASAVDVAAVRDALEPLLGPYLHVVPSTWTLDQVNEAESAAIETAPEPYAFGIGWDDEGRFRSQVLVHHVSPELASVVARFPYDILHVAAWVRRAGDLSSPSPEPPTLGNI
ncbi:hypothetical protein QE410_000577 [Microbacterium sp. SORGH_AS 1204]|uniref:hypothetical protein n=1 Tax=Microbacterium sp. SORGH_AS_1204 TaxID=3041785 RepID=UPI00278DACC6|nr:hypothetical protein [Microbacterium sp. SORGH_AS_1204]MDQ1135778.1 hypothetical protein [Microbacterium sp. SORGH_AS_1204]